MDADRFGMPVNSGMYRGFPVVCFGLQTARHSGPNLGQSSSRLNALSSANAPETTDLKSVDGYTDVANPFYIVGYCFTTPILGTDGSAKAGRRLGVSPYSFEITTASS